MIKSYVQIGTFIENGIGGYIVRLNEDKFYVDKKENTTKEELIYMAVVKIL